MDRFVPRDDGSNVNVNVNVNGDKGPTVMASEARQSGVVHQLNTPP